VGVTRLRWGLGAALVLLSLVTAAHALTAYWSHGLWLGSAAVVMLAAIAIGGLVSLGQARRRIARELAGLAAEPPTGELWRARVAKLSEIKHSDAAFDRDALAAATEAEERGRAYLGRYLVAVTVLVGLVGTFAGLMETLRAVAPLLRDDRVSTLQMLAAPLGGLDVTFGASVVGILVTLALSLVQGDLVLAEELALGRLEERTVHLLVPSLWPRADAADERAARELVALRADLATAMARVGEGAAARVAAVAGGAVERLVTDVKAQLDSSARAVAEALTTAAERGAAAQAAEGARATAELLRLCDATRGLGDDLRTLVEGLAARIEAVHAQVAARLETVQTEMAARLETVQTEMAARLETVQTEVAARLASVAGETSERLTSLHEASGAQLNAAHVALAEQLITTQRETMTQLTVAHDETVTRLEQAQRDANERGATLIAEQTRAQAESWSAAATATREALNAAVADAGTRHDAAAAALAAAAAELRAAVDAMAPPLQSLSPELGALAREVALLAARADSPDEGLVADELVRLGEGMERLESLLRLSRGEPA
jgi:hypothetical protein